LNMFDNLSRERLRDILGAGGSHDALFAAAREALLDEPGDGVYLRGLVEVSNRCVKNCLYCGLRRERTDIRRYEMSGEEVKAALETGYRLGLRSFLLQSGELPGKAFTEKMAGILEWCSANLPGARMVLSMGELAPEDYDLLRKSGGHRYLLRIETSSAELYRRFHPNDPLHSHFRRIRALEYLRDSGWQTGTGVLIGLPGQNESHLADDLLFMKKINVDMVGMGPYVECPGTPVAEADDIPPVEKRVALTLRMIALARLTMPGINIAATTALQTLCPGGLEKGLMAGANVIMPNLTPGIYREDYDLYDGKVRVHDSPGEMLEIIRRACARTGRRLMLNDPGDPPHYRTRMEEERNGKHG